MTYSAPLGGSNLAGSIGQLPGTIFYADPPTVDSGGIRLIEPASKPAFLWSINSATNSEPTEGNNSEIIHGYFDTYTMPVTAGPGDSWLDVFVADGYVVLYLAPPVEELSQKLSFFVTKDPGYIAENAAWEDQMMVVVDGPEQLIQAARVLVGGAPPPMVEPPVVGCPPGTIDLLGNCVPIPNIPPLPGLPSTPPQTPPGTPPLPGLPSTPPQVPPSTPPLPGLPSTPPQTPPAQPGEQPIAKAAAETPDWVLPVLVGVGALAVTGIVVKAVKR